MDSLVFHGIWQLARLLLTTDVRRPGLHAIRFGLVVVLYFAVCYASSISWLTAAGRPLFQSQLLITALFLSMTAIFGFSQTITEEKEEDTLGLMRLADISPLAIILGKSAGMLCDAALLIAIQFPFTLVAITLGGVSWPQVVAAYVALAAFLWLLVGVGVLASVLQPTGAKAARATAIVVVAYALPPFFARTTIFGPSVVASDFALVSLPARLTEITGSSFSDSPWCFAVAFGLIVGLLCILFSWFVFDRVGGVKTEAEKPTNPTNDQRVSRRCWDRPIVWREYVVVNGGIQWTLVRIGVQLAIVFCIYQWVQTWSSAPRLGFTFAWSAILSGIFGLLDGTWSASRLFRDEIRYKTWSALVQTPHKPSELAWDKCCGWALGLAPSIVAPFVFVLAMLVFHENVPREFMRYLEVIVGTLTIGVSVFGYLHLLVLLSLYLGWKATPMTLTICFAAGWAYVVTVYKAGLSIESGCTLFGVTSLAIFGLMLWLRRLTVRRLAQLAETA